MELATPRLLLREFRRTDHAAVHEFASDPEVVRHTDWGPNTPQDTAAFLREVAAHAALTPRSTFALAIVNPAVGALIGSIQLAETDPPHRQAEIGYVLARPWWGHGYATEATQALMRFGFDQLGLREISATCDPANVASARVLTKAECGRSGAGTTTSASADSGATGCCSAPLVRRSRGKKRTGTAELGSQSGLGLGAVETDPDRTRNGGVGPPAGGQDQVVDTVAVGDELAEFVAADRIGASHVLDSGIPGIGQLQKRRGQVRDVDRAAQVVGEEDTTAAAAAATFMPPSAVVTQSSWW